MVKANVEWPSRSLTTFGRMPVARASVACEPSSVECLEAFYGDTQRRESREIRFGTGWRSSRYELFEFVVFWVAATEELCVLRTPIRDVQSDGLVSRFVLGIPPHTNPRSLSDDEVTIEVLARIPAVDLMKRLEGWEDRVKDPDGIEWIRSAAAGTDSGRPAT